MYFGKHNRVWSKAHNSWRALPEHGKGGTNRLVINKIRPVIRTELAKLTSQKPSASVIPATSEEQDMAAATAAEQVWESTYRRRNLHKKFSDAAFWLCITGVGFIKVYWDPELLYDGQPIGDVAHEVVSPFHLLVPDLREVDIDDQPYVIHISVRTSDWAKRQYPEKLKGVNLENKVSAKQDIVTDTALNMQSSGENSPDGVLVLDIWMKPGACKDFPKGGHAVVINEHLVTHSHGEEIPGSFPFIKFEHIPTGKFYTESVIQDLTALNREYNRTRNQIIESKNRMSKLQMLYPEGSVDPAKVTTEPGQWIPYRPVLGKPEPLAIQGLPNYVIQELDRINLDFEDISGQHQVSKGSAPPGVTAATAIAFLQERDDSYLTHTYDSIEMGFEKWARFVLQFSVKYWHEERLVRFVGVDRHFNTMLLRGSSLASATDIRIEAGSALPTSKAAKQALIMDFMKMGFIDPQKGLEILEIGGVQRLYEEIQVDQNQVMRENLRMSKLTPQLISQHIQEQQEKLQQAFAEQGGNPFAAEQAVNDAPVGPVVSVNDWDNHELHVELHNKFRKSQEFEKLPDIIKNEFQAHINIHKAQIAFSQMAGPGMGPGPDLEQPGLLEGTGLEAPPDGSAQGQLPPDESGGTSTESPQLDLGI